MFNNIKNVLFSTRLTAFLLIVFAVAIGCATFIENDYGTSAAKAMVFNAKWFELVLFILGINLLGNIFKYKMYRKEKLSIFLFHVSFIIIVLGAGITRFVSFEGSMQIREGEKSNSIVSADTYFQFKVDDEKMQYTFNKKLFLNPLYNARFSQKFNFEGNDIVVAYKNFISNAVDTIEKVDGGKKMIELVTVGQQGGISKYLEAGQTKFFGNISLSFNDSSTEGSIQLYESDSGLVINSPIEITYLEMDNKLTGIIAPNSPQLFKNRRLYSIENVQVVFKELHQSVAIRQISAPKTNVNGRDVLVVELSCNQNKKEISLTGGSGYISNSTDFQFEKLNFSMNYGSIQHITPFTIQLNDFKLEKYPGSMSPSSFESEITLMDNRPNRVNFDQRIYMNNVLDYDGYRFFQSSYDQDEKGTILSVNYDFWGTTVTYIGYLIMVLGMISTLMVKKSRFTGLRNKIKELRTKNMIIIGLILLGTLFSQNATGQAQQSSFISDNHVIVDQDHAEKFGRLLVQDNGGRIKPIQTLASEVLRKISRLETFEGQQPTQVFLGMMYHPTQWQSIPFIKVSNPELEEKLGAQNHYLTFRDFFDENFTYIIANDVSIANRKKPAEQSKYDKELIKVDERVNICYLVFQGNFLKLFPKNNDANNTWFSNLDYQQFENEDSSFVKGILPMYFSSIQHSIVEKDWKYADGILKYMEDYQQKFGAKVIPEQSKIDVEILYNKINIFKKLFMGYGLMGLLMLFFLFANIFNEKKWKKNTTRVLTYVLLLLFSFHSIGLIARWYISGHAPWSNGYESMIYIAWVTMLAGFIFSKSSKMTIAATAILGSLVLMVAHLNFLDPEITPLVPVLKSYWLMIHVAVITGSYGFLGLGALLGFMNLLLMIFKTSSNKNKVNRTIKELTYINEMTITVGLIMAIIGTFLGGIWANESWGRYWGWDPKETWALVIVLVYATILHLRLIPKGNNKYLFNLLTVLGFSTVIMTYFGVNYYLSGLHSYATGDPVPIPTFVPVTVVVILVTAAIAYLRNKKIA